MDDENMDHQEIFIDDPLLPTGIRDAVIKQWSEGDLLFQVETSDGTEWWHTDCDGELIDGLWLDQQ